MAAPRFLQDKLATPTVICSSSWTRSFTYRDRAFDPTSNTNNNPYYGAASSLARSFNSDCIMSTFLNFLFFTGDMPPDYALLLERKDPCALLLLAYWYAKVCQYQIWWIRPRVTIECQAICIYLERHYPHESRIQGLLQLPKMMSGSITS